MKIWQRVELNLRTCRQQKNLRWEIETYCEHMLQPSSYELFFPCVQKLFKIRKNFLLALLMPLPPCTHFRLLAAPIGWRWHFWWNMRGRNYEWNSWQTIVKKKIYRNDNFCVSIQLITFNFIRSRRHDENFYRCLPPHIKNNFLLLFSSSIIIFVIQLIFRWE